MTGETTKNYWMAQLAGLTETIGFPTDETGKEGGTTRSSSTFTLPDDLTQKIITISNRAEPGVFLILLGGVVGLLSRYTGDTDFLLGMPPFKPKGDSGGVSLPVLPLRCAVGEISFKELLTRLKQIVAEAAKNQMDLEALRPETAPGIFDAGLLSPRTMISLENIHEPREGIRMGAETFFRFRLWGTTITCLLDHHPQLFSGKSIERFTRHFTAYLQSVTADPGLPLGSVEILSPEERRRILDEFNRTRKDYPDRTILALFEENAGKAPDRTALVFGEQRMTYGELNRRANQLAHFLREKGVGPEGIVGIMAERSFEMVVGIYGILKAGGAYLPLDPDHPAERIRFILEDSAATLCLVQAHLLKKVVYDGPVYMLENEHIYHDNDTNPDCGGESGNLAYIIYTSGSTGKPKGVLVEHRNVVNILTALQQLYPLGPEDTYLFKTTYTFDVSVAELFGWFYDFGQLAILEPGAEKDAHKVLAAIKAHGVTHLNFVPSMLRVFLEALREEDRNILSCLKYLFPAGEALTRDLVVKFCSLTERVHLVNLYGPTEGTIYAAGYRCDGTEGAGIPIGKPLPNVQLYILDPMGRVQSEGVPGELYIGGMGVARGYLHRPELTGEKFVRDPFGVAGPDGVGPDPVGANREGANHDSPLRAARLYRTGDLCRWGSDGKIEYLGRIDHQVKIRGYRIELGEIEQSLLKYPEIREAVVVARDEPGGGKYLCAYYTARKELTVSELRKFLAGELPEYMIPSFFVAMDHLPFTPSGKIDRKNLPAPEKLIRTGVSYVPPVTGTELKLAALWQNVLGVEKIGLHDNFFHLGGHSLKATNLMLKIQQELHVQLPLGILFKHPTIAGMVLYLEKAVKNIILPLEPASLQERYPVSSTQKRLYILHQVEGIDVVYNLPVVQMILGDLDRERLENAFQDLVNRHEALRTTFEIYEGEPVQRIQPGVDFQMECVAISEDRLDEGIRESIRPFDLAKAPLLRAKLFRLAENKHALFYDLHHIIADGISLDLLKAELVSLYQGQELPPVRIQFKDYAVWEGAKKMAETYHEAGKFWKEVFSGEVPVLNLPTDSPRPSCQSFTGAKVYFSVENALVERLRQIARENGATLYMVLLSAYSALLYKYSGQCDLVIGTPVAGRMHPDVAETVGMFVNMLALRSFPSGDKTFRRLLEEVREDTIKAFEHQEYQFEDLLLDLDIPRNISRNPLFDVVFVFQNTPVRPVEDPDLEVHPISIPGRVAMFDLTLEAWEEEAGINFSLEYSTTLFRPETAQKMTSHFLSLLEKVVTTPEKPLWTVEIISQEERKRILTEFNATAKDFPLEMTLTELFAVQVSQNPDQTALISLVDHRHISYRELEVWANRVAGSLLAQKVGSGTIIGILAERTPEMVAGILGILKTGGAFLPLDPAYPPERIGYMIKDSGAPILLSQRAHSGGYTGPESQLILEDLIAIGSGEVAESPVRSPKLPAYVMYTSGSTGIPKGVVVTRQNIIRLVCNTDFLRFSPDDRILMTGAVVFDATTFEIWGALLNGLTLCLPPDEVILNGQKLQEAIREQGITILWLTAPLFHQLAQEDPAIFRGLRYLLAGGDVLAARHINAVRRECPGLTIINGYGPTENTTFSACFAIDREYEANIPIGKPIANSTAYVVDSYGMLQPVGIYGELWVGGDGVANGYLNRPDLTAEKFVPDPFGVGGADPVGSNRVGGNHDSPLRAARLYRTGDLARWLPDGTLEFMGRIDHQVKIRGFRIEPGEIENRLLKHPEIKETVVIVREQADGNKTLCAYITGARELSVPELREFLRETLPEYMIPSYFIQLPRLPLTPNGKVDRKKLPAPDGMIMGRAEYVPPVTGIERKLAVIWQDLLGVERIGIQDHFFHLGGHSLKATILLQRIHREFGVELTLGTIFKHPTINGLVPYLENNPKSRLMSLTPIPEAAFYPLSSAQKRLYVIHQMGEAGVVYNIPVAQMIEGRLDRDKLESAFRRLINRHEALRTSFELINGEPVQRVHHQAPFALSYRESACEYPENAIREFLRPFDLSKAPLLRAELVRLGEDKYLLLYDLHHIIADGTSCNIIKREIAALYRGEELPETSIHLKDYTAWQTRRQTMLAYREKGEFWEILLQGGIPMLELPMDYPRPKQQCFRGTRHYFSMDDQLTEGLRKFAVGEGTTLYMLLSATLFTMLHRMSGQEEIIIGTPVAGRYHPDLERTVGMFVNTLALKACPTAQKTFRELLLEVKDMTVRAFDNQEYLFEDLVEALALKRDLSRNLLFDVMFVLQNTSLESSDIPGLKFTSLKVDGGISKFDLTLEAVEEGNALTFTLEYATALFRPETITRFAERYLTLLLEMTSNPDLPLAEYEIVTQEEKHRILVAYNQTHHWFPMDKTIHELFEVHAEMTPERAALLLGESAMNYRELNEQANRLAHTLRAKGVGPERIVGIMAERSFAMLTGLFAILKAGGAYLPLDPNHPEDRISFILEDSNATLCLVQEQFREKVVYRGETIILEDESLYRGERKNPGHICNSDHLAYIIYTSGSTGKPKGVQVEHRSVVNILTALQQLYPLVEEDTYLFKTTYTFDVSVAELFGWFHERGRLAILAPGAEKDPLLILEAIKRYQVTHLNFVPSMLRIFLEALREEDREIMNGLKYVFPAGEALPRDLVEKFRRFADRVQLVNLYGPTEGTVYATGYICDGSVEDAVPIGRPLPNVQTYIVDALGRVQPEGVAGELCIGGVGVARGYLNRPELTTDKFVPDPFGTEPVGANPVGANHDSPLRQTPASGRLYRTGDLARWRPDGNIEYLGRIDHQVKIRGYRIELGEIEQLLLKHTAIRETVVVAREETGGTRYLCAYYTSDRELTTTALREYLGRELPEYMIPSFFVKIEQMPLTPSGKTDRKALPEPMEDLRIGTSYMPPTNDIERKMVEFWQEVLGIEKIGIYDSFLELGGHSLKAMQIAKRIYQEFSVNLSVSSILKSQTVANLARELEQYEQVAATGPGQAGIRDEYPVSSSQKRMFILHQFDPESMAYNITLAVKFEGPLDRNRITASFRALTERHESLRTSFELGEEDVIQKVHPRANLEIEFREVPEENWNEVMEEFFTRPFELEEPRLIRVGLVQSVPGVCLLMLCCHHIIGDAASLQLILKEFVALYLGEELPPVKVQYKDFAVWQKSYQESQHFRKQEEYWLGVFENNIPPRLELPLDYSRPAILTREGEVVVLPLPDLTTRKLKEIAASNGCTLYMVLLSAYLLLLSERTGMETITVCLPVAGRTQPEFIDTVGVFINTILFRMELKQEETFRELLAKTRENLFQAFENQDYHFEELVDKLNIPRDLSRNPLASMMFDLLEKPRLDLPGLVCTPVRLEDKTSIMDMVLEGEMTETELSFNLQYNTNLFSRQTMEKFALDYRRIIDGIVRDQDVKIGGLKGSYQLPVTSY